MARKTHKRHKKLSKAARKRISMRNLRKAWRARRKHGRKMRRRRTRKCPKTRGHASIRSAKLCLSRRKPGRASKALKKLYAKCKRMLRRTKAGRRWLKKHGHTRRHAKK